MEVKPPMADKTIADSVQTIVQQELNQQPKPIKITITKVHTDNNHVDCKTLNGDTLTYIPTISNNPTVNNIGILFFLDNNEKIIITK